MINWLIKISLKCVSYETLVKTIAQGIAYVLEYARKSSSPEGWDVAKATIKKIRTWLDLFDEVYEDDELTSEEEKKIQDAIASCDVTCSIYDLLQGKQKKEVVESKVVESKKTTSKKKAKKSSTSKKPTTKKTK